MMSEQISAQDIETALQAAFAPLLLSVRDDGHLHVGHAYGGKGHFAVKIVSESFVGMGRVARHRAVYAALAKQLGNGIHALAIEAKAPEEASATK